jgi:hypothetical protein
MTATWFQSRITDPVMLRDTQSGQDSKPVEIVNAPGPARTQGSELIARFHRGEMDLIGTYMYVRATEADPVSGARREVELSPRHTAGIDWLYDIEGRVRVGGDSVPVLKSLQRGAIRRTASTSAAPDVRTPRHWCDDRGCPPSWTLHGRA